MAITKSLRETLEYLDSGGIDDDEARKLQYDLTNGVYNKPERPTEFIERDLEKYRQKREEMFESLRRSAVNQVSGSQ